MRSEGSRRVGARRWPARLTFALGLAFLYLPLARIVANSVNSNPLSTTFDGFTFHWYRTALADTGIRKGVGNSVRLALVASALSVVVGTIAAVAARRSSRLVRQLSRIASVARVSVPEIVVAGGLTVVLPAIGATFGPLAMLAGHIVILTPFVVLLVGTRAASADPRFAEAAADLGARPWQVFRTITLPDLAPAIAASTILSAVFSFDDVVTSRLLAGPQSATMPTVLLSMIQRRITPEIDAIGSLILAIGACAFVGALVVGRGSALAVSDRKR
jgi:ABC-type spermidine/putrescine transport system permease subunit II